MAVRRSLEHFPAECEAVRRKKMRPTKKSGAVSDSEGTETARGQRFPYAAAFGIYTAAFVAVASPWLLDFVRIPYDSVSQFYPSFAFLARSLAGGQSPFWTPT